MPHVFVDTVQKQKTSCNIYIPSKTGISNVPGGIRHVVVMEFQEHLDTNTCENPNLGL